MRLLALMSCLLASSLAFAQKPAPKPEPAKKVPAEKTFNIDPLALTAKVRNVQFLYFLERADEELERASLEKRSFVPRLVRSVDEEKL
jgi:hypothetical protein